MTSFKQLAQEADQLINKEYERIAEKDRELSVKASEIASAQVKLDTDIAAFEKKSRELAAQEEEVSRKLQIVRRDEEIRRDAEQAASDKKKSQEYLKEARDVRAEAQQKLEEVAKRELALSEREQSYKQEIELEIMRNMAFRK